MAQDGESTLRLKVQAETAAVQAQTKALQEYVAAVNAATEAAQRHNAARRGGEGGGDSGGGGGGAPAPAVPDGVTPAPNQGGSGGGSVAPSVAPAPNSGGPRWVNDISDAEMRHYRAMARLQERQDREREAEAARAERALERRNERAWNSGLLGYAGYRVGAALTGDPHGQGANLGQRVGATTGGFISSAASTAVGMGLGQSMLGFVLGSGAKYMELERILAHLEHRFGSTGRAAAQMGHSFGYTIGQTAGMVEAYGSSRDTMNTGEFGRLLGFSKNLGLDPSHTASVGATLGHLTGRSISNADLASIRGMATRAGMGRGRLGEYMGFTQQLAEESLTRSGEADLGAVLRLQNLPGLAFGAHSPLAQGSRGMQTVEGLNRAMTGSESMQIYMLRAMGFGKPGGPSYRKAITQAEAGVFGEGNVELLFKTMQEQGLSKGAMFRVLQGAGGLSALQAGGLTDALGDKEGLARFASLDQGAQDSFLKDYTAAGSGSVSQGEARAVQIEQMQQMVGAPVAATMAGMSDALLRLVHVLDKYSDVDITGTIDKVFDKVDRLIGKLDSLLNGPGELTPERLRAEYEAGRVTGPLTLEEAERVLREGRDVTPQPGGPPR